MKSNALLSFVGTLVLAAAAHASPYTPETFKRPGVAEFFSRLDGYARGYGRCYDLLRAMGPLREGFWNSAAGRTLLAEAPMMDYDETYRAYTELPCHLCEQYESMASYRQPCIDTAHKMDTLWTTIEQSRAWTQGRATGEMQAVFTGWERFKACMGW